MLSLQDLKDMAPDTIFATGETIDGPSGVNMTGSLLPLRWVAVRGGIHDWAVYIHSADWSTKQVRENGDKIHNRQIIKKLVSCDDEALEMYRD